MGLEVAKLSVNRGFRTILHEVSLTCEPGAARILRGPNGAGKTTLLRTLAGFIPAKSGGATLNTVSMSDRDDFQLQLTYAGHLDAIKPQMTVKENIKFWAELYGGKNPQNALDALDLAHLSERLAANCSAGQKRRLGLARLMISNRNLWLLDEPTVSLDTASRDALSMILQDHLKGGGMALIATHDPDLIKAETFTLIPPPPTTDTEPFLEGAV